MGGRPAPSQEPGGGGGDARPTRNGTSVPPRRLPATGGTFSLISCSGFLPSSSAFEV